MFSSQNTINKLESSILSRIEEFDKWFKNTFPDVSIDIHSKQYRTLYMLGRARGFPNNVWVGILPNWVSDCSKQNKIDVSIDHDSWFNVDLAAVEYFNKNQYPFTGKYRLHLLLEHENDPKRIFGYTRKLLNFNVPEKLLIIWTNNNPQKLLDESKEIIEWSCRNGINLVGNLTVLAGDWAQVEGSFFRDETVSGKILHVCRFKN